MCKNTSTFPNSLFKENVILNSNRLHNFTADFFPSWATMHGPCAHDSGNLKVVTNVSHTNQVLCHIYNISTFIMRENLKVAALFWSQLWKLLTFSWNLQSSCAGHYFSTICVNASIKCVACIFNLTYFSHWVIILIHKKEGFRN